VNTARLLPHGLSIAQLIDSFFFLLFSLFLSLFIKSTKQLLTVDSGIEE
jgi:hypothetical protein